MCCGCRQEEFTEHCRALFDEESVEACSSFVFALVSEVLLAAHEPLLLTPGWSQNKDEGHRAEESLFTVR